MNQEEQLDELLRDVAVPGGLKNRLKQIAQVPVEDTDSDMNSVEVSLAPSAKWIPGVSESRRFPFRTILAIATGIMLLVSLRSAWNLSERQTNHTVVNQDSSAGQLASESDNVKDGGARIVENTKAELSDELKNSLAEIAELDRKIAELRAEESRMQLAHLNNRLEYYLQNNQTKVPQSNPSEQVSRTLLVAAESAWKGGIDPDVVRDELQRVVDRYPGTTGASGARDLLISLNVH